MMTCSPLSAPEDLKVLIKEGIAKLCNPHQVQTSYEALRLFAAPKEPCATGLYLLVVFEVASEVHMRLVDVLLCQPDFISEDPISIMS